MSADLQEKPTYCPYCGETITLLVDLSVPEQEYVEDCSVCCRPMDVHVVVEGDEAEVYVHADTD